MISEVATPNFGRSSPASSYAERAATPSPLLRNCHPIGRSTPQFQSHHRHLSSLSEGVIFDGNNNSRKQNRRSNKGKLKGKHVTYEEIDRRSSSTFDADLLDRGAVRNVEGVKINIIVNKVEDDPETLVKKPTIVSANHNKIFTNVFADDDPKPQSEEKKGIPTVRITPAGSIGFTDSNVSILIAAGACANG